MCPFLNLRNEISSRSKILYLILNNYHRKIHIRKYLDKTFMVFVFYFMIVY